MAEEDLPDWTTDMDEEILDLLSIEWILTPAVIAENIGRTREAVSRRLNTLEAGGLVEKTGRGKYRISEEASELVGHSWRRVELSEEEQRDAAREEHEKSMTIQEELGLTEEEYHREVEEEYERLKQEKPDSFDDLLSKAFEVVDERHKSN